MVLSDKSTSNVCQRKIINTQYQAVKVDIRSVFESHWPVIDLVWAMANKGD